MMAYAMANSLDGSSLDSNTIEIMNAEGLLDFELPLSFRTILQKQQHYENKQIILI
jgi:hypothetical protein